MFTIYITPVIDDSKKEKDQLFVQIDINDIYRKNFEKLQKTSTRTTSRMGKEIVVYMAKIGLKSFISGYN